eukprot:Pgem_evm2s11890
MINFNIITHPPVNPTRFSPIQFDGTHANFRFWKLSFLAACNLHHVDWCFTQENPKSGNLSDEEKVLSEKAKTIAMSILTLCLTPSTITYAINNTTPFSAYQAILTDFERKTKGNRFSIRRQIMTISLKDHENLTSLVNALNDLCSLYHTLTDHSKSIDDEEKLVALTNALNSQFDSTIELLFNDSNTTYQSAIPLLLDREQKLSQTESTDS